MLCREKRTGTRVGTSVIAACGEPLQPASTASICKLSRSHRHAADVQQLALRCTGGSTLSPLLKADQQETLPCCCSTPADSMQAFLPFQSYCPARPCKCCDFELYIEHTYILQSLRPGLPCRHLRPKPSAMKAP